MLRVASLFVHSERFLGHFVFLFYICLQGPLWLQLLLFFSPFPFPFHRLQSSNKQHWHSLAGVAIPLLKWSFLTFLSVWLLPSLSFIPGCPFIPYSLRSGVVGKAVGCVREGGGTSKL